MIFMNKKEISKLKKAIFSELNKEKINAIVFFGSRARGDHTEDSDYDINVFFTTKKRDLWGIRSFDKIDSKFQIHIINPSLFKEMKEKSLPFIYCSFRDGVPLYQKNKWFDKTKEEILKLKPRKKAAGEYLERGMQFLANTRWHILQNKKFRLPVDVLEREDGKVAANHIGFGLSMFHGKFPRSPHSLKKELAEIDKSYNKIVNSITYLQRAYYENTDPKLKSYIGHLDNLYSFSKNLVKKYFPEEYKEITSYEKMYKAIEKQLAKDKK